MRVEAPSFDACPIYSAPQHTDLRSKQRVVTDEGTHQMHRRIGRTAVAAVIATIASTASAALVTASASNCDDPALEQPFARWGDNASYKLLGNGGFESGATGWTLSGGAYVASGNESFDVGGADDSRSLVLPGSSRAVSPFTCV